MNNLMPVHILLAEDTPTDAEMTMRALKKVGLVNNITWVTDGQQALDYIAREGEFAGRVEGDPTLIMLDLKMPKVNGMEVLKSIKGDDRTRMIPVIMLTSSAEEPDIVRCYEMGVNSYLVKPVESDKFFEEVSKAGFYWAILNRIPGAIAKG
ncbi:response regulator [Oxalicibacterium solurbis]|uniref:Response regulator n=1 Tax=Oxalicibacterium solurbis TaxID=69280 RepID=A0A8J3AZD5_9BURK|nr:response regulator [Oxalicibacterium solurbis]GGI54306.1 response regulator [Oxalicibacterium solurbis]